MEAVLAVVLVLGLAVMVLVLVLMVVVQAEGDEGWTVDRRSGRIQTMGKGGYGGRGRGKGKRRWVREVGRGRRRYYE